MSDQNTQSAPAPWDFIGSLRSFDQSAQSFISNIQDYRDEDKMKEATDEANAAESYIKKLKDYDSELTKVLEQIAEKAKQGNTTTETEAQKAERIKKEEEKAFRERQNKLPMAPFDEGDSNDLVDKININRTEGVSWSDRFKGWYNNVKEFVKHPGNPAQPLNDWWNDDQWDITDEDFFNNKYKTGVADVIVSSANLFRPLPQTITKEYIAYADNVLHQMQLNKDKEDAPIWKEYESLVDQDRLSFWSQWAFVDGKKVPRTSNLKSDIDMSIAHNMERIKNAKTKEERYKLYASLIQLQKLSKEYENLSKGN